MKRRRPNSLLVGDGIENPANAVLMQHAAAMFGADCRFRDTKHLAAPAEASPPFASASLPTITSGDLGGLGRRVIAFDNLPGARDVYGFQPGRDFALLVGNERRGLSREMSRLADDRLQVPMASRRVNTLNVAAASAVALYYLCGPPSGAMAVRGDPAARRPELLLYRPGDHFEAGSTIRSAAAFGWQRALLEDAHGVWFSRDRAVRAEGRAAARRGKNDILLVPCRPAAAYRYPRVTVITCRSDGNGVPLGRARLDGGAGQLVVIPDESGTPAAAAATVADTDWSRFGARVELAHLQLPVAAAPYHYRLIAAIALAEMARQVGRRPARLATAARAAAPRRPPIYDDELARRAAADGEWMRFADLQQY